MTNTPEYDFSSLRPDELNSTIAGLTALNKRSAEALKHEHHRDARILARPLQFTQPHT